MGARGDVRPARRTSYAADPGPPAPESVRAGSRPAYSNVHDHAPPADVSVALVTLGCARNEVDSEELAGRLAAEGFRLVDDPADADTVVVNTCGFVEAAKKDSVDTLLEAADLKESGRAAAVVAVGCLAERYGEELAASLPEADAVLGFDDYPDIAARLRSILAGDCSTPHTPQDRRELLPITPTDRARRRCRPGPRARRPRRGCSGQRAADRTPSPRRRPDGPAQARQRL